MSSEQLIARILAGCQKITREELESRLEKEKKKTGGLIADDALLRVIAAELGVKVSGKSSALTISLENLVPNLGNVTVCGRVVAAFPVRIFDEKRGRKIGSLLVADEKDIVRVVLWNDRTCALESGLVKVGDVVRVSHGYTKEDKAGRVELHVGEKSEIEVMSPDAVAQNYPTINKFTMKIGKLTSAHRSRRVNIEGTVKEFSAVSVFERSDASSGHVMHFLLVDQTGEMPVVAWNEKAVELEKILEKGMRLQVVNARVKSGLGESFEVHVDSGTYVAISESVEEFVGIRDLCAGMGHVSVEGEVASKPVFRDVKTAKDEVVKLASFELKDSTGRVWVSAWREKADAASHIESGDTIAIRDAFVRKGFCGHVELSTRASTSISKIDA